MKKIVVVLFFTVLTMSFGSARAVTSSNEYLTSYTVTLTVGQPVTNIMLCENTDVSGSTAWAFQADPNTTTILNNPFPSTDLPQSSLLLGIVQGLPGDASLDQKHVVLFMDDNAANLSNNIAWGTLFPNTSEDTLIADIELATSGLDGSIIQPGLDAVGIFTNGDATNGILGPGGVPASAWFATGGTFSVMTWSNGTIIGSGFSEITQVPEPASLSALAFGGAFILRFRRRL